MPDFFCPIPGCVLHAPTGDTPPAPTGKGGPFDVSAMQPEDIARAERVNAELTAQAQEHTRREAEARIVAEVIAFRQQVPELEQALAKVRKLHGEALGREVDNGQRATELEAELDVAHRAFRVEHAQLDEAQDRVAELEAERKAELKAKEGFIAELQYAVRSRDHALTVVHGQRDEAIAATAQAREQRDDYKANLDDRMARVRELEALWHRTMEERHEARAGWDDARIERDKEAEDRATETKRADALENALAKQIHHAAFLAGELERVKNELDVAQTLALADVNTVEKYKAQVAELLPFAHRDTWEDADADEHAMSVCIEAGEFGPWPQEEPKVEGAMWVASAPPGEVRLNVDVAPESLAFMEELVANAWPKWNITVEGDGPITYGTPAAKAEAVDEHAPDRGSYGCTDPGCMACRPWPSAPDKPRTYNFDFNFDDVTWAPSAEKPLRPKTTKKARKAKKGHKK
jgi:hypothetical protein